MIVIRLAVLAALVYVAWLLVRAMLGRAGKPKRSDAEGKGTGNSPAQDVLVEDPVCHTLIPKHQAIRLRKDETTYYFCSEECCDKFSQSARGEK